MGTKYAIVVGAAGGIGNACVETLLAEGWHVFGLDIRQLAPNAVGRHDGAGKLTPLHCDVSDCASVEKAFIQIGDHTDKVNALICCSGILRVGPLDTMTTGAFDSIFAVNVRGPWLCAKAAVPFLERASQPSYPSRLIFLSSVAAFRPKINGGAYSATKAALETITRAFAGELAAKGILVNAVAPGPVDTPFIRQAGDPSSGGGYKPGGQSPIPIGRIATPREVVSTMKFLLGDDSAYMTGAIIALDGGISAVRT